MLGLSVEVFLRRNCSVFSKVFGVCGWALLLEDTTDLFVDFQKILQRAPFNKIDLKQQQKKEDTAATTATLTTSCIN
jgi:hypothetical protein